MGKILSVIVVIILAGLLIWWGFSYKKNEIIELPSVTATPIPDKSNLIKLEYPIPNQVVASPLIIRGQARGNWFFEASFPVELIDSNGKIIASGIATAQSDWMTEDFVPFEAELIFEIDTESYSNTGTLILHKDNPSGMPELSDALEIIVKLF